MLRRVTAMSLGVGTQLLGNIVKLMRHKVKGEIICILALLTIPKRIQIMREKFPEEFHAAECGTFKLDDLEGKRLATRCLEHVQRSDYYFPQLWQVVLTFYFEVFLQCYWCETYLSVLAREYSKC